MLNYEITLGVLVKHMFFSKKLINDSRFSLVSFQLRESTSGTNKTEEKHCITKANRGINDYVIKTNYICD